MSGHSHDADRYNAFLHQLANDEHFIIVKEINGTKYFTWISVNGLKALLGI